MTASTPAPTDRERLSVLHGKFSAYLAWSQPFIWHLITGLEKHVDNTVICNRSENLERFPVKRLQRIDRRYITLPARTAVVANKLRLDYRPDVLHAHFGWSGIRMLMLKQFLRLPLVTTFGGRDAAVQMHLPGFDEVYRALLAGCEQIVCVSTHLQRQILDAGVPPERVCVVHRGTNLDSFAYVDRSAHPAEPVRVLMVGRLVEKKGHADAFRALGTLVSEGLPLELVVLGEGEQYAALRKLRRELGLRDAVKLIGPTDQAGVREHMARADIFLHCSVTGGDGDAEGIPNVVVEAAATGLPVVGTEHGGIVEPVRDGETGLLVKEHDVAGLTEALRRLIASRETRLEMGRAARRFMESDFDLEGQIQAYLGIYERLVSEFRSDADRRNATWVPPDFDQKLESALTASSNAVEFSVSELFEELTAPADLEKLAMPKEPGTVARAYEVKKFIPHQIKFPVKLAMREVLVAFLRLRSRFEGIEAVDPKGDIDELVMDYFRSGGDLESLMGDYRFQSMPHAKVFLSRALKTRLGGEEGADADPV